MYPNYIIKLSSMSTDFFLIFFYKISNKHTFREASSCFNTCQVNIAHIILTFTMKNVTCRAPNKRLSSVWSPRLTVVLFIMELSWV